MGFMSPPRYVGVDDKKQNDQRDNEQEYIHYAEILWLSLVKVFQALELTHELTRVLRLCRRS
jgi:hypothetical protein